MVRSWPHSPLEVQVPGHSSEVQSELLFAGGLDRGLDRRRFAGSVSQPEALALRREEMFGRLPSGPLADHARSEARIAASAATRLLDRVHHLGLSKRERLGQARLEDRRRFEWKAQHHLERARRAGVRGPMKDLWNLCVVEPRDDRRHSDGGVEASVRQCSQRLEALARWDRDRLDRPRIVVPRECNSK